MPCTSATFERVKINSENNIQTDRWSLDLKYLGKQSNVCVYKITGSPDSPLISGELFLNKTTNQITLSYLIDAVSRDAYSINFILTKNGNNSWSGSQIEGHVPPVGECAAITNFSFVK
jgi:hypothetical protein